MSRDFRIELRKIEPLVFTQPDTYLFAVPDILLIDFISETKEREEKIGTWADITDFILLLADLIKKEEGSVGFVNASLSYRRAGSLLKLRLSAGKEKTFEREINEQEFLSEIKKLVDEFLSSVKANLSEDYRQKLLEYWKKGSREDWPKMAKILDLRNF